MTQRAFAVFMALHGAAHAVGFMTAWQIGGPRAAAHTTALLNGSVDVGETGIRIVGLWWLALTIAFLGVAVLLWRRHPLGLAASAWVLAFSLNLCFVCLPGAWIGLVIDLVLLGLLAMAPGKLVARAATA